MNSLNFNSPWNLSSRIHRLNHFPKNEVICYVKRDDELGCGITGTKLRKYASLLPYFRENGIEHLVVIAGAQSNNLLAAAQIARELGIQITAFLIKPWKIELTGNFKLTRLFLDESAIYWIDRNEWPLVEERAREYCTTLRSAFLLTEGASVLEGMPGAKSLAYDIARNELESNLTFDHLLIDAGTGFSATGLITGLQELHHSAMVHVLLLADTEEQFRQKFNEWSPGSLAKFHCFSPHTAKSFGSVNHTVRNEVHRMAREEGILVDPIYSAKLFHESRAYIVNQKLKGTILIIHSGGALTLSSQSLEN